MNEEIGKILKFTFINEECEENIGIKIKTEKSEIVLELYKAESGITGFVHTDCDLNSFIGARIIDVYLTDDRKQTINFTGTEKSVEGEFMFLNVMTNKGLVQFVIYDCYGRDAYYSSYGICSINFYESCEKILQEWR